MSNFPSREPIPPLPPLPWGKLVDEGRVAAVIRFVTPQHSDSWPMHALIRWTWTSGETEALVIYAAGASITIHGRKLEALRDALDAGRLQQVQVMSDRAGMTAGGPFIRAIAIADS